ncbi:hypothetical protein CUMW_078780 [Citrus unshiu]|uniref:Uncharacterized protein n=1 Tax=Citrus unshiu TaxID=55188 RepID=A0A2H5NVF6_CITUN|nr:hypothetical protein CUMW_078780 [Citrus unshiu]
MTKFKRSTFFIPSAETYSKASIRWIGYDHLYLPCWLHALQWFILQALTDAMAIQLYCIFNEKESRRAKSLEPVGRIQGLKLNPLLFIRVMLRTPLIPPIHWQQQGNKSTALKV